jgi:ABC-type cobalamin/Fe3+-siderophores transport system ATPase subunit
MSVKVLQKGAGLLPRQVAGVARVDVPLRVTITLARAGAADCEETNCGQADCGSNEVAAGTEEAKREALADTDSGSSVDREVASPGTASPDIISPDTISHGTPPLSAGGLTSLPTGNDTRNPTSEHMVEILPQASKTRGGKGASAAVDENMRKIQAAVKRGDVDQLIKLLADYIEVHKDRLHEDLRDTSVRLMARRRKLMLSDLDDGERDIAKDKLAKDALVLLRIVEDPDASSKPAPTGKTPKRVSSRGKGASADTAAPPVKQRSLVRDAAIDAIGIARAYPASSFNLEPIDVTVKPGEILAISGVNGSGKSTLIDILRGALAPDSGTVHYPRISLNPRDWRIIKANIGYVPQRSNRWRGTVRENLEHAAAVHGSRGRDNPEDVRFVLERHGLEPHQDRTWNELSSGYRLRFDLALARLHQPQLLILDEPMANLDLVSQQELLFDVRQMADLFRMAIIITS